mgnify:CR=1 FL=1
MNDTVPYNPEIVQGISTEADEYLPLISPDQEIVLYTRRGISNEFGVIDKKSEDFVFSEGSLEDSFNDGEDMPFPFNQNNNEGGASITIDNKVLFFTICSKFSSSYNNCDIYYVEKEDSLFFFLKNASHNVMCERRFFLSQIFILEFL